MIIEEGLAMISSVLCCVLRSELIYRKWIVSGYVYLKAKGQTIMKIIITYINLLNSLKHTINVKLKIVFINTQHNVTSIGGVILVLCGLY